MDARPPSNQKPPRKLCAEVAGCIICYALKIKFAIRGAICRQGLIPAGTLHDSGPRPRTDWGHIYAEDYLERTSRFLAGISPGGADRPADSAQRPFHLAPKFLRDEPEVPRAHCRQDARGTLRHAPRHPTGGPDVRSVDRTPGQL